MSSKAGKQKKKTILVIEDDFFLIKAYQIKFEMEGFNVWTAADGQEALSFFEKEPADLVILDLMLPKVSGFSVLESIRKSETWKNVPVVILSNLGQAQDVERCKAIGICDYLVKANVKIKDIVEKVKKFV